MPDRLYKAFAEFKAVTSDPGGFEGYGSLFGVLDSGGDIVEAGAFRNTLPQFIKNGFIADGHNWDSVSDGAIGTIADAREDDRGLFIRTEYHSTQRAQDARKIAMERMARGKSVGLSIGYSVRPGGMDTDSAGLKHLLDLDLFEVSHVNVPMLRPAGMTAVKSLLDIADLKKRRLSRHQLEAVIATLQALMGEDDAEDAPAEALADGEAGKAGDAAAELKAALRPHHTATSDATWDNGQMWKHCGNTAASLRDACAWVDPNGDPTAKASYKFIHHMVAADGTVGAANLTACSFGIGVLNGARSGTTIPDADKAGVHAHLAGHLKDAGQESPPLKSDPTLAGLALASALAAHVADLKAADAEGLLACRDEMAGLLRQISRARIDLDALLKRAEDIATTDPSALLSTFERLNGLYGPIRGGGVQPSAIHGR